VKAGITTLCIHKGLLPPDYEKSFAGVWGYATAWDIGKAAKDWPQMSFVIYHSALRAFLELPDQAWAEFETTGRINNAARLYRLKLKAAENTPMPAYSEDRLTKLKGEYELAAREPTNLRYGYVRTG
jgi:hypothetical protein